MTDAEFSALLDEAVLATGVERYRYLCSGANTLPSPNSRDDWRRWILERRWEPGAVPESDRPTVARSLGLARAMGRCPFRSRCSCSGGKCALKGGAVVSHRDCFACLERFPDPD